VTQIAASAATAGVGLSADTSRLPSAGNLEKAGQQFESLFVGMMLKSMRQATLAEGLLDSDAGRQFRDMQDQRTAESMAATTPLGIGKAMTEFLGRSAALATPAADPAESKQP
jgi:flagellar protein FlgJ